MLVIGLAAAIGCGGISKETYGAKEAEAAKYKQQVTELQSQVASLEKQNATVKQQASSAQSQLDATTAKLNEQSAEFAAFKERSKKISAQLLFKENSSKLTPENKRALDSVADAIGQVKDKAVIVAGYTDNTEGGKGATAKRWQLSTARAMEVAKYLAGRGIDPNLIGVAGFGESRPVAPNDTLANKALNRRAEIALTPKTPEMGTVEVSPAKVKQPK
jgi:chemotaxis protein MotB